MYLELALVSSSNSDMGLFVHLIKRCVRWKSMDFLLLGKVPAIITNFLLCASDYVYLITQSAARQKAQDKLQKWICWFELKPIKTY